MRKWLLLVCLLLAGVGHVPDASAQATIPYLGWSRITNGAMGPVLGPDVGMCVDVPRSAKTVGTVLTLFPCHQGQAANQLYKLEDGVHAATRISVFTGADQRCLGYRTGADGTTRVVIDLCATAPQWRIDKARIHPVALADACMAAHPVDRFLTVGPCEGRDGERFGSNWGLSQLQQLGEPRQLRSAAGGFTTCVDVEGASRAPGTSLIHYTCGGGDNQWLRAHRVDWVAGEAVMLSVYSAGETLCLVNLTHARVDAVEAAPCDLGWSAFYWRTNVPLGAGTVQARFQNWLTGRCLTAYQDKSRSVGSQPCDDKLDKQWRR